MANNPPIPMHQSGYLHLEYQVTISHGTDAMQTNEVQFLSEAFKKAMDF